MKVMKKTISGILLLISTLLLTPATWAIEIRPDTLVEETAQEILKIIKRDKDTLSDDKEKILDLVKYKILPHFNFTRMTRLAMGKNWSKASPQQQQELEEAFRTLLVRTYYKALAVYSDHTIKVSPVKNMAGKTDTTVKTEVIPSNGQAISINYSMEKTNGAWKVYDITVAGISLVINYRGTSILKSVRVGLRSYLKHSIRKIARWKRKKRKKILR